MTDFANRFLTYFRNSPDLTSNAIETLGTILFLWLVRLIIVRVISKRVKNKKMQYKWRKNVTYVSFFVGLMIIAQIWFAGVESLATFLGLLSAGIAIALKDHVTDLAA